MAIILPKMLMIGEMVADYGLPMNSSAAPDLQAVSDGATLTRLIEKIGLSASSSRGYQGLLKSSRVVRIQSFGISHDHLGGALHLQRLFEPVCWFRSRRSGSSGCCWWPWSSPRPARTAGRCRRTPVHHQHVHQLGIDRGGSGFGSVAVGGGHLAGGIAAGGGGFRRCAQGAAGPFIGWVGIHWGLVLRNQTNSLWIPRPGSIMS